MTNVPVIVGDVGGTNCRFSLAERNSLGTIELHHTQIYPVKNYSSFYDAMEHYLTDIEIAPKRAAFAFAGPKFDATIRMTNVNWIVSEKELAKKFGLNEVATCNDFVAMANGARLIPTDGFQIIRSGSLVREEPIAVFGPGTGLGQALSVPSSPPQIISTEGGHSAFAPETDLERDIDHYIRRSTDYVSNEMLLCGAGLFRIYQALSHIHGEPEICTKPEEIVAAGEANPKSIARKTVLTFNSLLGAYAGNLALSLGAKGGVIIAGGVSRHVAPYMAESDFETRFTSRGQGKWYVENIPVRLMMAKYVALYGAAEILLRDTK